MDAILPPLPPPLPPLQSLNGVVVGLGVVVVGINTPWHEFKLDSIVLSDMMGYGVRLRDRVFIHSLNKTYVNVFISILLIRTPALRARPL